MAVDSSYTKEQGTLDDFQWHGIMPKTRESFACSAFKELLCYFIRILCRPFVDEKRLSFTFIRHVTNIISIYVTSQILMTMLEIMIVFEQIIEGLWVSILFNQRTNEPNYGWIPLLRN